MKKYLLLGLLTFIGLFGAFASADTVGNYSSSSDICAFNFSNESSLVISPSDCGWDDYDDGCLYAYLDVNGVPFYMDNGLYCGDYAGVQLVSSSPFSMNVALWDSAISFCSDTNCSDYVGKSGTLYMSANPITYNDPNAGNSGNSGNGSGILVGGISQNLTPVLSSLQNVIYEFIPYLVYMGLGVLIVTLGFISIKRLVNYVGSRVTGIFSSKRRK